MGRLTELIRIENEDKYITTHALEDDIGIVVGKAISRLAEYENTGLTPKEIIKLREKYEKPNPKCNRGHENTLPLYLWDCPMCTDKLREENAKLRKENQKLGEMILLMNDVSIKEHGNK